MSAIEKQLAIYHMTSNPEMYEVKRKNTFEFVVPNLEDLLRAGANGSLTSLTNKIRFYVIH